VRDGREAGVVGDGEAEVVGDADRAAGRDGRGQRDTRELELRAALGVLGRARRQVADEGGLDHGAGVEARGEGAAGPGADVTRLDADAPRQLTLRTRRSGRVDCHLVAYDLPRRTRLLGLLRAGGRGLKEEETKK
jgi:hypothetical protein